jgi:hypothetical protein
VLAWRTGPYARWDVRRSRKHAARWWMALGIVICTERPCSRVVRTTPASARAAKNHEGQLREPRAQRLAGRLVEVRSLGYDGRAGTVKPPLLDKSDRGDREQQGSEAGEVEAGGGIADEGVTESRCSDDVEG